MYELKLMNQDKRWFMDYKLIEYNIFDYVRRDIKNFSIIQ